MRWHRAGGRRTRTHRSDRTARRRYSHSGDGHCKLPVASLVRAAGAMARDARLQPERSEHRRRRRQDRRRVQRREQVAEPRERREWRHWREERVERVDRWRRGGRERPQRVELRPPAATRARLRRLLGAPEEPRRTRGHSRRLVRLAERRPRASASLSIQRLRSEPRRYRG